jgi:predicted CXXCH cytochrome family protein
MPLIAGCRWNRRSAASLARVRAALTMARARAAQQSPAPAAGAAPPAAAARPAAPIAPPARRAAPATAAAGTCVSCHATVTKHTAVHPKVAECESCHVPKTRDAHAFDDKKCSVCHQMVKKNDKFVHGPVAAGECLACHDPHGSDEPAQVRVFGSDLCQKCHVDMKARLAEKRFTHAPVKEDCATCHNPHASPSKYQIRNDSAEQCLACHKTLRKELVTARVQHEAVSVDRECVNCHDPHASDLDKQLKGTSMTLCLSCHDKEQDAPGGKVQNVKGWLDTHKDLHGPIRQQDCVGCHLPHDSEHFRLLRKDYPEKFYSPYDPKNYELCFTCHEPDLAKVERTATVTGFRDGDLNLHFLHVNRTEKGRTCRACHEAHSSTEPKHLRETVPFGDWQMPVGYTPTSDGGRCAPGCHLPKTYSRALPRAAQAGGK